MNPLTINDFLIPNIYEAAVAYLHGTINKRDYRKCRNYFLSQTGLPEPEDLESAWDNPQADQPKMQMAP